MIRLNRRRFLQGAAALAPMLTAASVETMFGEPAGGQIVFAGTQTGSGSKGIYAFHWDAEHGRLGALGLAAETPMPTFLVLSPDRSFLFTCNETDQFKGAHSGGVSSFRVAGEKLQPVDSQVADGTGTTNVGIDHTGRVLLCANYEGGSVSSFPITAGAHIGRYVSHFQYTGSGPNKARQLSPHAHRAGVSPGNRFALFNDLGLDVIHIYQLDVASASLQPHTPAVWKAPPGSGPRSLRFHPNGRWAYCVCEINSTVVLLDWDENAGTLTERQTVQLLPPKFHGRSQASETAIDRAGRFLYAADRYYDGLYSFNIDPDDGTLHDMVRTGCGGRTPRYITLDPSERWLLATNQDSNGIAIFARDPRTGRLAPNASSVAPISIPQCLVFV